MHGRLQNQTLKRQRGDNRVTVDYTVAQASDSVLIRLAATTDRAYDFTLTRGD